MAESEASGNAARIRELEQELARLRAEAVDYNVAGEIPGEIGRAFARAERLVRAYFAEGGRDPERGTLSFQGERYVMVSAVALATQIATVVRSLYWDKADKEVESIARRFVYETARSIGRDDARRFLGATGITEPLDRIITGPMHFAHTGWARVRLNPDSTLVADSSCVLHYEHASSFEADAWIADGRPTHLPVCLLNAGYSAGWCEESFGIELVAFEMTCRACGDARCQFVMAPPDRVEAEARKRYDGSRAMLTRSMRPLPSPNSQEEARRERQRLTALVQASPDGVMLLNQRLEVEFLNPSARRLLGVPEQQAADFLLSDFVPAGQRQRVEGLAVVRARSGGHWTGETVLQDLDGESIPVVLTLIAHPSEVGVAEHFSATFRDLREQRDLEARLQHSQRQEALGRLAGGVAHDFNNLLTSILGNAELASFEAGQSETVMRALSQIVAASEQAGRVTDQLLAFARRQVVEPRAVDVSAVLTRTIALLRRVIPESIRLTVDLGDKPAYAMADEGQVEQLLMNLLINAGEALGNSGQVSVTVSVDKVLMARDVQAGTYVAVCVDDDGPGVPKDLRSRIFEPFFTTKDDVGTGLGLSNCLGIARQAGGTVRVSDSPAGGARFQVLLPRTSAPTRYALPEVERVEPLEREGVTRIVLVEDDELLRRTTADALDFAGYVVEAFESAEEAMERLAVVEGVSLVLSDVILTGASGAELAEWMHRTHPSVPVMLMSGYTADVLARRGLQAPVADGFLAKPFRPSELFKMIESILNRER